MAVGDTYTREQFVERVRVYMRDTPATNALLDDVETSQTMMDFAVDLAIDDFNTTPPKIGTWTYTTFPSLELLLYGTIIHVLQSAGLLQSRNQLTFVDGGIQVATSDKTPLYQSWINTFKQNYETLKLRWKKSTNLESCYGGVHSEYLLAGSYGGYAVGSLMDTSSDLGISTTIG